MHKLRNKFPKFIQQSLSKKLIFLILIFSSLITFILTTAQLASEYFSDVKEINQGFSNIDSSYSKTIAQNIWNLDIRQLETIAEGIHQLPHITFIKISSPELKSISFGERKEESRLHFTKTLHHAKNNSIVGSYEIQSDLHLTYERIKKRAVIVLISQAIKTYIVTSFMFFIVNYFLITPISKLTEFIQSNDPENLNAPNPKLNYESEDELGILHKSFQSLLVKVRNYIQIYKNQNNELVKKREELKLYKDELEIKIQERTKQYKEAKNSAEKANTAKSIFLANMSHELRTPLNSIILLSNLISKNTEQNLSDDQLKQAQTINSAGKDLLNIISDILDISKIEAGKMQVDFDFVNLDELLNHIFNLCEYLAVEKNIKLTFDSSFSSDVFTDREKLSQILKNLVSNALKFTDSGHVSIKASPSDLPDYMAKVEISDSGIGMSKAFIDELFGRFRQESSDTSTKFGGSGLGLYISKRLAELLQLKISVNSEQGVGTTFDLYIKSPNSIEGEILNKESTVLEDISNEDLPLENLKIALADDEARSLMPLKLLLESDGAEVFIFGNGQEVIKNPSTLKHFDIFLLDLFMPELDGLETFSRIRDEYKIKSPIILFTAAADKKSQSECLSRGVSAFISKPIDYQKLKRTILGLIDSEPKA